MQITTVQWNIGGGKILKPGPAPINALSYTEDGLEHIVEFLKSANADVITLQEIHKNDALDQAEYFAKQLGMKYYVSDFYDDSHIEKGQKLGQAILSKFPISDREFQFYINPNKETASDDGLTIWHSHDKGRTRCSVDLGNTVLQVATTHLVPFRKFSIEINSEEGRSVLSDIESKLITDVDRQLIQGDFNLDVPLLSAILPKLATNGFEEVRQDEPTTPKGRHYDHIAFRGIRLIQSKVTNSVLTDHYPITTKLEVI
jgi:endonuclease/exonuclease/phosphatase family metal-dependent hydrolase